MSKDITYWDYLKLNNLLNLQGGVDNYETNISNDELHFILIHQVYELNIEGKEYG